MTDNRSLPSSRSPFTANRSPTFHPGPALSDGQPDWFRECVRDLPVGLDAAEATIRARLKRVVVERCIYGVDLDPLAVELARLSLWIETMDRDLPFGFLDHKLKCGNALVGCWFDRFQEFPALCLHRPQDDAGDKNHSTAVHCEKGSLSARLKAFRNDQLKPSLAHWIEAHDPGVFGFIKSGHTPNDLHTVAVQLFQEMHALPVHETEERARFYRERIQANPDFQQLREAFDTWCALWFWPVADLDHFPLPVVAQASKPAVSRTSESATARAPKDLPLTGPAAGLETCDTADSEVCATGSPNLFTSPSPEARAIIRRLRDRHRFFHWELEFPDVFTDKGSGFDAMLGNPPWEVQKPNSKEWFSNHDPLYRTYGKQEALRRQETLFELDAAVERDWLDYCARFKALSNWCANVAFPWGDPDEAGQKFNLSGGRANTQLHAVWRSRRAKRSGYADAQHPFRHQGSADLNTYKLFLEQTHALLRVPGSAAVLAAQVGVPPTASSDRPSPASSPATPGEERIRRAAEPDTRAACAPHSRMGVIVPSNIYTDKGSTHLRVLFLDHCRWEWLFGFENRERLFDIDSRFKFCPLIIAKGGRTDAIRTAFMRRQLADWEDAEAHVLDYPREQVVQFSPESYSLLEITLPEEMHVAHCVYENRPLLGTQVSFTQQFDATTESRLFPPAKQWEDRGYTRNALGFWQNLEGDVSTPVFEGRMVNQFSASDKGWYSGTGRTAVWHPISAANFEYAPQYVIGMKDYVQSRHRLAKAFIAYMKISSSTNARSFVGAILEDEATVYSLCVITAESMGLRQMCATLGCLNSFTYDFIVRIRLGGLNITGYVLRDTPLRVPAGQLLDSMAMHVASLNFIHPRFSRLWQEISHHIPTLCSSLWTRSWAVTGYERLRRRAILDALSADCYGLSYTDFAWVLRDCDHGKATVLSDSFTRTLSPKGFWRVDKEKDPELRHTVLSLVAFHDLQRLGLDAFLALNDGEGWMLPETLRLADYGLGHDDRAREPQPVAARLGPRFHPWQLEGTVEESWQECHHHAENLRLIRAHGAPGAVSSERSTVNGAEGEEPSGAARSRMERPSTYTQPELFGEALRTQPRKPK